MPKRIKILVGLLIIISFIFLLNFFQKEVKSFFYSISSPVQKSLWQIGEKGSDFLSGAFRAGSLKKKLDELTLEKQKLQAELVVFNELKEENKVLREALGIELEKEFKLLLVNIIGKDISQDFIVVDKGSDNGILKNMPVITPQKILLGRVNEVYDKFSKVMLISNKKSFFDADVKRYNLSTLSPIKSEDVCGIVKGKGGLKIFLDLISKDEEISQGDIVVSSSLRGVFPSDLLVGEIADIKKNDIESFQQAEIKPAFDIREINYLFVITEY